MPRMMQTLLAIALLALVACDSGPTAPMTTLLPEVPEEPPPPPPPPPPPAVATFVLVSDSSQWARIPGFPVRPTDLLVQVGDTLGFSWLYFDAEGKPAPCGQPGALTWAVVDTTRVQVRGNILVAVDTTPWRDAAGTDRGRASITASARCGGAAADTFYVHIQGD